MSIALYKDTEATIRSYAKRRGIEAPDAANRLINTAIARLGALAKYANKQKAPAKKGAKGGAKKGAKSKGSKAKMKKAA